ncbi:MAG: phage portal protein [bacterium]|jgi:lambda family phage portal protein
MKQPQMSWLDRAIGFISPAWAYKRAAWRQELLRNYDAGSIDRLNSGWVAVNGTAEQMDQPQRDIIRARARDLERNSDIAEAIIGPLERNVVGTGIHVQAKVMTKDGKEDEELNAQIEDLWEEWCRPRNCDVTGQQSFAEMQAMAIRRTAVDGGIFFIKAYTSSGVVPLSLQAREVDELDTSLNVLSRPGQNRIVGGIEMGAYNKPVAYWLKKYTPDGFWTGKSERIDAKRAIFLWKKNRPTQIREISPLGKTLPRVRDINEFVEAVSVKERILACLAVFIKKLQPSGGLGRSLNTNLSRADSKSGYTQNVLSPGMIKELQPGEEIQAVMPSGQAASAKEFISTQQRLAGAGQGLSYEAVSRDMSQVNYSSARQGLLEDQRTYGMWQQFLIEHLCREVYTEFVISAVLSGQLNIPDFWQDKRRYLKHIWIPPGWSWIDPLKEANANRIALATGQTTLAQICAETGGDWREMLEQRAREVKLAKELGLELNYKGGASGDATEKDPATGEAD